MLRTTITRSIRSAVSSTSVRHATTVTAPATSTSSGPVSLSNIEAAWKDLSPVEQESTFKALEELQKKDWRELTLDEKKASYYVAFGPHGPREPILAPGGGAKTFGGVILSVAAAAGLFYTVRLFGNDKPKTMSKEWQEASTARAIEQKQDPFTGPASKGYTGKGYVTAK